MFQLRAELKVDESCRFISAVLSAGIVMCLTSSVGHIAAETSNTKMLACVSMISQLCEVLFSRCSF